MGNAHHNVVRLACGGSKLVVCCRYPSTTSGQHLLDKYAQTHAGYNANAKHAGNGGAGESFRWEG